LKPRLLPLSNRDHIRRAATVQDGHSITEEAIYKVLWGLGKEINPDYREVQVGYGELARRAAAHASTVKRALRSLVNKGSIVVTGDHVSASSTPKKYAVYSYREILRRRKEAGLTAVTRNHGIRLVQAEQITVESTPTDQRSGKVNPAGEVIAGPPQFTQEALEKLEKAIASVVPQRASSGLVRRLAQSAQAMGGDIDSLCRFIQGYQDRCFRSPGVFVRLVPEEYAAFLGAETVKPKTRKAPDPGCSDCHGLGWRFSEVNGYSFAEKCHCTHI
jgi:hypothetical protein